MSQLRDYQAAQVEGVREAMRAGKRAILMQAPTGAGKTFTAAECIRASVALGFRVVFAAHLDALIDDTSERLEEAGIEHGVIQAARPRKPDAAVQVASLATLHRRQEAPPADLFILDECHRAMASTVRGVLDRYPRADLLGLTATPQRGDGQPLGDVFEVMVPGPSMKRLIEGGRIVPARVYSPPSPTLRGALAMDPVEALERYAPARPAMVFARDARHAEEIAAKLGARASVILGDTPRVERHVARARLRAGEPLVLVGCGVFVEGWDSPEVEAVVLARSFGVCGSYLQACGRALRPSPATGKTHATIIDLAGAAVMHGLPEDDRVWRLDGPPSRAGADLKTILLRCAACFAVFHSGPAKCPRCGGTTRGGKVARRATRVERQELARLDERPLHIRDGMALDAIERVVRRRGRCTSDKQVAFAVKRIFQKQYGRAPQLEAPRRDEAAQ